MYATRAVLKGVERRLRAPPLFRGEWGGRLIKFVVVELRPRHERGLDDVPVFVEREPVRYRRRGSVRYGVTSAAKRLEVFLIERDERVVDVVRRERPLVVDDSPQRTATDTKPCVPLDDIGPCTPPRRRLLKGFCKCPHYPRPLSVQRERPA